MTHSEIMCGLKDKGKAKMKEGEVFKSEEWKYKSAMDVLREEGMTSKMTDAIVINSGGENVMKSGEEDFQKV